MLHTFRTYRAYRVLMTVALLFGMSLPLMQYTCEMSGDTMPALAASASGMSHHSDMACCHGVPSRVLDVLCIHMACCPSKTAPEPASPLTGEAPEDAGGAVSDTSCAGCISETAPAKEALIPVAKVLKTPLSLLPAVAVLTSTLEEAPRFVAHRQGHRAEWPPGPQPHLHVLFASFLL